MTTQTALRLANALGKYRTPPEADQAAAELRRLHDEVQQLKSDLSEEVLISNAMLEVKDELLEVLKEILDGEGKSFRNIWDQARAAINKAEGEMK